MRNRNVLVLLAIALLFVIQTAVFAEVKSIEATGEYVLGDNDTFTEAKKM